MNDDIIYAALEDVEAQVAAPDASCPADQEWPEPVPLTRPLAAPALFPAEALGPVLENAAKGIVEIVQCPLPIAACSVLAAASLASQAHADVVHPATGRSVPTSLFFLTIAESGERKSAADAEALSAVRKHEEAGAETYKTELARHRNSLEAYETARALVKKKAKVADWLSIQRELQVLGDEPKAPRRPDILVNEPTYEGLARLFSEGQPSLGLFSAEGGGFLGGHAMREEGRLRALTGLSELWDGSPLRRTRSGDGALLLAGRRLAVHLMVQPHVAPMLLGDEMANGQGFLSRLLVCAPASTQGTRFQRDPQPWAREAVEVYSGVVGELLSKPPRLTKGDGLDPLALGLSEKAKSRWRDFADDMERELAGEGLSSSVRGLRNKTPEMALRISGVLAVIDGESEVTVSLLERGIVLALFFLSEAKRLYEQSCTKPEIVRALKLLRWLTERKVQSITLRDLQLRGPGSLRDAQSVKEAVAILEKHGLCFTRQVHTGRRPSHWLFVSPLAADAL